MNQWRKTRLCLFGLIVVVTGITAAPSALKSIGLNVSSPRTTVAQRYPLRKRSNDFYNRSKISYSRSR